jgi:LysR family hydrogen peroxide-inducible transcriptional activator
VNLRDLEYLVAVADHRHFGRAADACFVSQPTLSTQIRKLERELGVELFERAPRQVLLTAPGERVVERARVVLRQVGEMRDIARRAADPEALTLRIGLFPTLGPYLLPHLVPGVRTRFPRLELLLVEEKTHVLLERLRSGELDVAVLALPVLDDGLRSEPLFAEEFLLAVPADHPLAAGDVGADLSVLTGEHVLLLEDGHCLREQALEVCHLAGAAERSGFRATSLETLRQMVAAGVGITLLPELAVSPPVPPSDDVVLRRFTGTPPRRRIAMFWRPTNVNADVLPRLAAGVRELLADAPVVVLEPEAGTAWDTLAG